MLIGLITKLREIVFGVQDGLISNVALTTSMAIATESLNSIIIAGITGAIAGTFSMASGAFLSSRAEIEVNMLINDDNSRRNHRLLDPLIDAIAMGLSFLVAALIPILPYFILVGTDAVWCSVTVTLISLFMLGLGKGFLVKQNILKSGLEVFVVGMGSAAIGYLLGECIPIILTNLSVKL